MGQSVRPREKGQLEENSIVMREQITAWIEANQLIRMTIVKHKAGRQTIHGRILHYASDTEQLLVYDVDYKVTHHLKLNEIDELIQT